MTQEERDRLGARLLREQRVRFYGVAKDAYNAAGVNSATWKRAVNGESIKPHTLIQIVVKLWPETAGDWTQIPDMGITDPKLADDVAELREVVRRAQISQEQRDAILNVLDSETG